MVQAYVAAFFRNIQPDNVQNSFLEPFSIFLQTLLPQIEKACEDSIINMFEKIGSLENEEKRKTLKGMKLKEVKMTQKKTEQENKFEKPPAPISKMTNKQMTIWFPRFIRWVYKVHGVIPTNLWAVLNKKTGEMEAPNPPCPVWDETIINPKMFTGMNKAYPHGNIQMLLSWLK